MSTASTPIPRCGSGRYAASPSSGGCNPMVRATGQTGGFTTRKTATPTMSPLNASLPTGYLLASIAESPSSAAPKPDSRSAAQLRRTLLSGNDRCSRRACFELSYFGLTAGLPPGVPGGGIIGILAPVGGGVCFISGSISAGGVITPPDRFRSELEVPLAGGTAGVAGWAAPGRAFGPAA